MRTAVVNRDINKVKYLIFTGQCKIDDPIEYFSQHTILHDAVILNRVDMFDFAINLLIIQKY